MRLLSVTAESCQWAVKAVKGAAERGAVAVGRSLPGGSAAGGWDADVIVVGGGHNGLVCAAYLAAAGAETLLLEARDSVGGCASTVEDAGRAARFNVCSCDHMLVRSMPFIDELNLSEHGLRYAEAEPPFVYTGYPGSGGASGGGGSGRSGSAPWLFFNDVERTVESLARHRRESAAAYERYCEDALPVAELVLELSTGAATTPGMLASLFERRFRGAARMLRWGRASAVEVLGSYFDDEALVMPAVSTGPTVWGVPPTTPGTGMAAALYALRHSVRTGRPVGGSGALTDALAAAFVSAGGRVRCGAMVSGLVVDRAVRGVRLADGAEIAAPVVVAACDPAVVASQWLEPQDVAHSSAAGRFVARGRADLAEEGYESKIDAVIGRLPRYCAIDEWGLLDLFEGRDPNESSYVVSPSPAELAEAHRLRAQGRVARRPTLLASVPSVLDESLLSDGGEHVLSLEVLFTPYSLRGGWPSSAEPERWLRLWSELLQPGFPEAVRCWRAMTPDVYEREFHLSKGYVPAYKGSPTASFLGLRRELSRHRAPVPGLFLSGGGTYPGAGVWGAAGRHTAEAVLRSLP